MEGGKRKETMVTTVFAKLMHRFTPLMSYECFTLSGAAIRASLRFRYTIPMG